MPMRILAKLALVTGLVASAALAQKPPAPAPAPPTSGNPSAQPGLPTNTSPLNNPLGRASEDMVMFLMGKVSTADGTLLPSNMMVERVCGARVKQQVYTSAKGDFTMELGGMNDTIVDASGDGTSLRNVSRQSIDQGIPRTELANCELRASASGFRSREVTLAGLTPTISAIDVGSIVVERTEKVKGATVSATPYRAPDDARKAYERGLDAERKGKLGDARENFQKAVALYPKYASAWFQLGTVLEQDGMNEAARTAFTQATTADAKFLPPYLALAAMSFKAAQWNDVLKMTGYVMERDPLTYSGVPGYILDMDPMDFAEAYFYNAAANYKLNNAEAAEQSGLRAERLDVRPRFPQLHLLLAEIFTGKSNYGKAISELQTYLELAPHARDAEQVRGQIARLQAANTTPTTSEKAEPK
jgi:TolA-binding protein